MLRKSQRLSLSGKKGKGRISPLMLIGACVPLVLMLIAGGVFVLPRLITHAADVNGNCSLIVPPNPLSAQGLATPYQLVATDPANGVCNESNADQAAFVQGAIIDPVTGKVSVYNPLVIDQGTQPAQAPVVPKLPRGSVVGLWFGFNGDTLTLQDNNGSLRGGRCVNGTNGSLFGQFAYCNAPLFFAVANQAMRQGKLKPPALGMGADGQPCPTTRDFSIVDMDQSDNVVTSYLVTADGTTAQMTAANAAALPGATVQINGSDERLLAVAMDNTLGCTPWTAPDLADPGSMVPALPLNELQAAVQQATPAALIPAGDPMVLIDGQQNLRKLNSYRVGVNQSRVANFNQADTKQYCTNLMNLGPARIQLDAQLTKNRPSPDAGAANTLFTFLAQRFVASFEQNGLNCTGILNMPDPIKVTTDGNGVAIDATITLPGNNGDNGGNGGNGGQTSAAPGCSLNGTVVAGCTGTAQINGQTCTLAFDAGANQVSITCPAPDAGQGQPNQDQGAQPNQGDQQPTP